MSRTPEVPTELRPPDRLALPSDPAAAWSLRPIGARQRLTEYLRAMWSFREFAATVPLGQLAAKNQDTALGKLWNLLNPLLLVGVYFFIFQVVLGIESRRGVDDYLPFLTVGVISYNFTRASVHGGALAIVKNRGLLRSLSFPRALLPLSAIVAQGAAHLWAAGPMLILLLMMGVRPGWAWLLFPVVLLLHGLLNLGLALFTARFTFHFRDFEKLLPYLLRLGFYGSGILIPLIPEFIENRTLLLVLQANPVYMVIDLTRQVLLGYPAQPAFIGWASLWTAVLLIGGFVYFRRAEERYGRV